MIPDHTDSQSINLMKIPYAIVLAAAMTVAACGNANQINGRSLQTANKSVLLIKERLPAAQKVEFEIAFWTLRSHLKAEQAFLQQVDGKTAEQIIALGKAGFEEAKAAGNRDYAEFSSWEDMLAQQVRQRNEQDRTSVDPKDKKGYPRVDYKMHAM